MDYDVAISYASEDVSIADAIATRLRRDGFSCFYGPNRMHKLLGLPLPPKLAEIYGAEGIVVVALISKSYLEKEWTMREFRYATSRDENRMIVVKVDDASLPPEVADLGYADLRVSGANGVAGQISAALEDRFEKKTRFAEMTRGRPSSGSEAMPVSDIAVLDHSDHSYRLDQVTFTHAGEEQIVDTSLDALEFDDLEEYVRLGSNGPKLGVTKEDVFAAKAEVRELVDRKRSSGWQVFNGKKFGVSAFRRSRTEESEEHLLNVVVYLTDYFTSQFAKRLYRRLRARGAIEPDYSRSLTEYAGLLRSFGFDLLLLAPRGGEPHLILSQRSANIANSDETQGHWHVAMNEGLSLSDRYDQEFDASATTYRGFFEELGLERADIARVELFEPFVEERNFEPAIFGVAYTRLDANVVLKKARQASDTLLEHGDLKAIPATAKAIRSLLDSGEPLTNVLAFCLESCLRRGIFL